MIIMKMVVNIILIELSKQLFVEKPILESNTFLILCNTIYFYYIDANGDECIVGIHIITHPIENGQIKDWEGVEEILINCFHH